MLLAACDVVEVGRTGGSSVGPGCVVSSPLEELLTELRGGSIGFALVCSSTEVVESCVVAGGGLPLIVVVVKVGAGFGVMAFVTVVIPDGGSPEANRVVVVVVTVVT